MITMIIILLLLLWKLDDPADLVVGKTDTAVWLLVAWQKKYRPTYKAPVGLGEPGGHDRSPLRSGPSSSTAQGSVG